MNDPYASAPSAKPDEPGLIDDLMDIFTSPGKVFARRSKGASGGIFFAVAIALAAVLYTGKNAIEPIMEAQMRKGMAAAMKSNPNMTAEQMQSGVAMQMKLMPVFLVLGAPFMILGVTLIVWIAGKIFGAAITFGSSLTIASLASVPRIVGGIITDIQGLTMADTSHLVNPSQLSLSPARFMDPVASNQVLLAALLRLDLMTIWVTVLIGIAYVHAGKLDKQKATLAALTAFVLGSLFPLWGALRGG